MRASSVLAGILLLAVLIGRTTQPVGASVARATPVTFHTTADPKGDPINGRKVFLRENCYGCHGGRAGGGMCLNHRDNRPGQGDVEDAVLNGRPKGMPSFRGRVTLQEIADLAAYFDTMRSPQEPTFTHWWEPGTPTQ